MSLPSALAIVVGLAATVLLLEIALDAKRVIAWAFSSMAFAALVQPAVTFLSRYMSRGLAVLLLVVVVLGSTGLVVYRIVDDVSSQTKRLQELAPKRAKELEKDSELLHEIDLTKRVRKFVDAIPERLRGGSTAAALRSAANRGLAFVAGTILTLFFVLYGPRLVDGAFGQIHDADRRRTLERVVSGGTRPGLGYARWKVLEVLIEGLLAFGICHLAGVPGPAALGVWVGLWTLLPVAGLVIGAIPIVVFAGADSGRKAVFVALAFVAIGICEWLVTRVVERRTVHVGSFLPALALFAGIELYGFMGALLLLIAVIVAMGIVAEVGPEQLVEELVEIAPFTEP
jgi:predicted PurR-regulated permease PerM